MYFIEYILYSVKINIVVINNTFWATIILLANVSNIIDQHVLAIVQQLTQSPDPALRHEPTPVQELVPRPVPDPEHELTPVHELDPEPDPGPEHDPAPVQQFVPVPELLP